jgi:hypothetical protein
LIQSFFIPKLFSPKAKPFHFQHYQKQNLAIAADFSKQKASLP